MKLLIQKVEYAYLRLIPHTSSRNYNTSTIAKSMHLMGKNLLDRIYRVEALTQEDKEFNRFKKIYNDLFKRDIVYKQPIKCTYIIDIKKDSADFILVVPRGEINHIKEKITEVWNRVTIEEIEGVEAFDSKSIKYELRYKYNNAFSLDIDRKSNEPLNQIFTIMEYVDHTDRISLIYNFIPYSQYGWSAEYKETMKKLETGASIEQELSAKKIAKLAMLGVNYVLETFIGAFNDLFSKQESSNDKTLENIRNLLGLIENKKELSNHTKKKRLETIVNTQLLCVASGNNKKGNAISVCQSFTQINGDNELIYKQIKGKKLDKINIEKYDLGITTNKMSIQECNNLIQLPGKEILSQYTNIRKVDTLEVRPPVELLQGYIPLGTCTYKGAPANTFMSNDKNLANLGLVILGPQGAGKTEYIGNYSNAVVKNREGMVLIDFIKNCELSETVKSIVPKDKLIEINLDNYDQAQSFGFNELKNLKAETDIEKLEIANMQTQLVLNFINAINPESPLSGRMRRSLASACNVVFIHYGTALRQVIDCMQDHRKRQLYIDMIPESLKEDLQDDINNLQDMDEKGTKGEEKGLTIGTKDSKIEFVIDRVNLLIEDLKLKRMFNKSIDKNIDFVKEMDAGKVILIKMPEAKFNTKFHKNILTTFYVCKIWLASQIRGSLTDRPLRTHIVIDEIFQAPTAEHMLLDILPQARKFQTKFVLSAHYLNQIELIKEALKASGSSYMLLQGTDKKNYEEMKEDLAPFELDDLLNLERWHSLNMIKCPKGYAKFITNLPKPIGDMKINQEVCYGA